MTLTGSTFVAGVIGWPVEHSKSPRLHNYWLNHYGIDGVYVPMPVRPDQVVSAFTGLKALGLRGANVTVPHKESAFEAADHHDALATRLRAVNTLIVRADGSLEGRNTDGYGFLENLRQGHPSWRPESGPAVVLGAGGAARAVIAALTDVGVPEIRLINRTTVRAENVAMTLGGPITVVDWGARANALDDAGVLVNTTSLGMVGQAPLDLNLDKLPPAAVVNDIVYAPLETSLLACARARGNPVVDGLGMLLHQARPGFAAWFGTDPEVTDSLRNYVLGHA